MSKLKRQSIKDLAPEARLSPEGPAERHPGLVARIAHRFQIRLPSYVEFDELVASGSLGLVEAARRFDPARRASFTTFATHRIRGAITDNLRRLDPLSRDLRAKQRKGEHVTVELMARFGRHPTEGEIAELLGLSLAQWRKWCRELHQVGYSVHGESINGAGTPVNADEMSGAGADPEQLAGLTETRQILDTAIETLPPRYRRVIHLYHFEDWTM